jgi:flavin prenyltransferase
VVARQEMNLTLPKHPFPPFLENMLRLARAGAVVLPANPGFYHHPQSVQDLVDFVAARILDHLRIPQGLMPRWGEPETE